MMPDTSIDISLSSLPKNCKCLGIAVSGGADSVALLHLLLPLCQQSAIMPFVLCFDHAIAGENSAAETAFVRDIAASLHVDFISERASPPVASSPGLSIEMAARKARYAFFERIVLTYNLDAIALAHHRDDVAESLLLRLLRGSGATGLSALRPLSFGVLSKAPKCVLFRPLLAIPHSALCAFLAERNIPWMEDFSNTNTQILRNRVRHRLLPAFAQAMNLPIDEIAASLAQSASILCEEDLFLQEMAKSSTSTTDSPLEISVLEKQPKALARRVVRNWFEQRGFPDLAHFRIVEEILSPATRDINLPRNFLFHIENGLGTICSQTPSSTPPPSPPPLIIPAPGRYLWGKYTLVVEAESATLYSLANCPKQERSHVNQWPASCHLPASAAPFLLRARKNGDAMQPYGFCGTKKVQDIFVDEKLPRQERSSYPLLFSDTTLAWIPGYRTARSFSDTSTNRWKLTLFPTNLSETTR